MKSSFSKTEVIRSPLSHRKRLVWLEINASYSHSSLAIPAIDACRCGDTYDWSCLSMTINSDQSAITSELFDAQPDMIAATVWLFNHEMIVKICDRIKALKQDVVIALGGAEFNGDNEDFLRRNRSVDFVFRGEGERSFPRFLCGAPLSSIEGLCYIDDSDRYVDNGTARVADFEELPTPESSSFFRVSAPFVQIESSRGCFNSCAFCVSGGDKPIRSRSLNDIEERIEKIRNHGVRDIRVLDRTFNYSPQRAGEMLQIFSKFPDMNFHLEIHPALLTDGLIELLGRAPKGLLHLEAGMQSLDDKVIEACDRIGGNRAAIDGLRRLCKMDNFETHTDLIAGLPHYTLSQIFDDVRELAILRAGEIQLELLKLLPGTKMRRDAGRLGIVYNPNPPYEVLKTPAISVLELNRARLLSKLIDRFYNAKSWQNVTRQLIEEIPNFLARFLDYLIDRELLDKPIGLARCGSLLHDFCRQEELPKIYIDEISKGWIRGGFSLRTIEAGDVTKATELPNSIERRAGVHYYLWRGSVERYIVIIDRSQDHTYPTMVKIAD